MASSTCPIQGRLRCLRARCSVPLLCVCCEQSRPAAPTYASSKDAHWRGHFHMGVLCFCQQRAAKLPEHRLRCCESACIVTDGIVAGGQQQDLQLPRASRQTRCVGAAGSIHTRIRILIQYSHCRLIHKLGNCFNNA